MSRRNRQIINWILFSVFTFYYVNVCFFTHTHIVNGTTIVHSHIHNKAHTQTETHTESELTLISALSSFHTLSANVGVVGFAVFLLLQVFLLPLLEERVISNLTTSISLRAPPALV
ncbi:hypothetical protein [Proteiniphilum sp.]|uniref:hypothetical protein n=1 Tax=Proteiniphilum sp. TaxID=1926877 RepID=UPI002B1FC75A|nr:hypothetical protein [Proteiniphilum sp.]